jgi:hypothetical protein
LAVWPCWGTYNPLRQQPVFDAKSSAFSFAHTSKTAPPFELLQKTKHKSNGDLILAAQSHLALPHTCVVLPWQTRLGLRVWKQHPPTAELETATLFWRLKAT